MEFDFLGQYNAFLFDLDGTLIDSKPGILNSLVFALAQFGIVETDEKRLNSFIGPPVYDSLTKNYGLNAEDATRAVDFYRARYAEKGMLECSVYPGVFEVLSAIKERGHIMCLATSKLTRFAVEMTYNLNLNRFFDFVQGGDRATWADGFVIGCYGDAGKNSTGNYDSNNCSNWDGGIIGRSKYLGGIVDGEVIKKPETVRLCLNYAYARGATSATTLMVGDRKFDADGAVKNGIDCAGLLYGYGSKDELLTAGAKYILPDISALIK